VQHNFKVYTRYDHAHVEKDFIDKTNTLLGRDEFRKNLTVDKKDFAAIEYLLRKGQRQLEMYSSPGIRNIMR
jgi:succinate dehydrogenase assembly factor 1